MAPKITVGILFLAFLFNASGYLNVYHFMYAKKAPSHARYLKGQDQIKVVTQRGLDELGQHGFERMEEDEYVYEGRWYDVVRTEKQGAKTVIYLAHDSYEEELISFLKSFFQPADATQNDPVNAKLTHDLLKQYLPTGNYLKSLRDGLVTFFEANTLLKTNSPHLEVPSPPPRFLPASF